MKKKLFSEQLVKAIAVGISASMVFQPMTAFACEGNLDDVVPSDPPSVDTAEDVNTASEEKVDNYQKNRRVHQKKKIHR